VGEPEIEALAPLSERFVRPDWVRRMNAMGDSVGGARRLVPIDADELLEQASEGLGGGAFGDFADPDWRRRLHALVDGVNAIEMTVVGRLMTRQEILRSLRTRLLLAREWDAKPGIQTEKIVAPIVVTGPARSGTSILFELLWLDPNLRGPIAAEVLHPLPIADFNARDPRLPISECEQEFWADVQPEFGAIHELRSDLPVECVTLTEPSFCGSHWAMIGVSGAEMDMPESYAFEKRLLQVLQHGRPAPTWLLKTPGHLMTIDLVFETFPDAWVVMTHRDPARTMPSTVSTTAVVQWIRSESVDLPTLVRMIGAVFSAGLASVSARRAAGDLPDRFVDVHFQDLLRDPVDAIRRAYAAMERAFEPEHEARIRRYLEQKPRGKFGVHRYTPEEWGFTAAEVRANLREYIEREGIELEA
jgi:hypothetical protein